jgi:protein ImuB
VLDPPAPAQLSDEQGNAVMVSGRGEQSAAPARVQCTLLPAGGGSVRGWAGPWASDVRWWDPPARRRCARWQVVVDCGADAGDVACIVVVESGRAGIEAIYD